MSTPFGPQLIGETEKSLNAILRRALLQSGLTEGHWVTLRLAAQLDVDAAGLVDAVTRRAHIADATELVEALVAAGLLAEGRLTEAGRHLLQSLQAEIAGTTAPIWHGLDDDDVAATTRVLNEVAARARHVIDRDV